MVLLVVTYLFGAVTEAGVTVQVTRQILYTTIFIGTALAADLPAPWKRAAVIAVLVWVLATALDGMLGLAVTSAMELATLSIILVGSLLIVFREIGSESGAKTDVVAAAVFGFLLMALAFALVYVKLEQLQPGTFDFGSSDRGPLPLVYFSMVTITTLGFGDIVPVTHIARILTGLEAAFGLMYVAVFISRAVGRK